MKTSITLTLRAFPVIVENTETQEVKKGHYRPHQGAFAGRAAWARVPRN